MRRISVEQTKYPPEDETKNILTWTSLDLIETLLALAEGGLYDQVGMPLYGHAVASVNVVNIAIYSEIMFTLRE